MLQHPDSSLTQIHITCISWTNLANLISMELLQELFPTLEHCILSKFTSRTNSATTLLRKASMVLYYPIYPNLLFLMSSLIHKLCFRHTDSVFSCPQHLRNTYLFLSLCFSKWSPLSNQKASWLLSPAKIMSSKYCTLPWNISGIFLLI